ncbi:MAG: hypothetical protein WB555_07210, partial [Candidatus Korobacteraceae bacterium]
LTFFLILGVASVAVRRTYGLSQQPTNIFAPAPLIPIGIMNLASRYAVVIYWAGLLLGLAFLYAGWEFSVRLSRGAAHRLLLASIPYLPLLFGLRITFQ